MVDKYIDIIYNSLKMTSLDSETSTALAQFMEAYHKTLDEHLNSPVTNPEVTSRLQTLTGPVNAALSMPDDGKPHPAVDFIKEKIQNHGMEMEKGFAKVLKNPNVPSVKYEDETMQMNGFSLGIIVVIATLIAGFALGALLFFIK